MCFSKGENILRTQICFEKYYNKFVLTKTTACRWFADLKVSGADIVKITKYSIFAWNLGMRRRGDEENFGQIALIFKMTVLRSKICILKKFVYGFSPNSSHQMDRMDISNLAWSLNVIKKALEIFFSNPKWICDLS